MPETNKVLFCDGNDIKVMNEIEMKTESYRNEESKLT